MNFGNLPESKHFDNETAEPTGLQYVKGMIGNYLYKHQWVKGATGQYYNPAQDQAYQEQRNSPLPKLDAQGRRADIDWGSNASLPGGATPLMSTMMNPHAANDAMARKMGFKDAATAIAYRQRQQEMSGPAPQSNLVASSGFSSLLDQALAIHPAKLLGHVIDAFDKAGQ